MENELLAMIKATVEYSMRRGDTIEEMIEEIEEDAERSLADTAGEDLLFGFAHALKKMSDRGVTLNQLNDALAAATQR